MLLALGSQFLSYDLTIVQLRKRADKLLYYMKQKAVPFFNIHCGASKIGR